MGKTNIVKELWAFLKYRKRFWLAPVIILLLVLSALIMIAQSSSIAPFIYTIF